MCFVDSDNTEMWYKRKFLLMHLKVFLRIKREGIDRDGMGENS
jgi:hypothetical protein